MIRKRSFRRALPRLSRSELRLEHLEDRRVLDSTMVFNEIMYNPVGPDEVSGEWIEFYNQLAVDIDVSEWVLTGGVEFTFPDQTIIPGKGFLIVAADPVGFETTTGAQAIGPWDGRLSNGGEDLLLFNNDNRLMNRVDYDDEGDWSTLPDGNGVTLSKSMPLSDSEDFGNWTHSEQQGGTPAIKNFREPGDVISTPILTSPAPVTSFVPTDDSLGMRWIQPDFDDSNWLSGTGGVGFDRLTSYDPFLGLDLDEPPNGQTPSPMRLVNSTAYVRYEFDAPADMSGIDLMELRVRFDDGFVAYLNGVEIASANAPGRDGDPGSLSWSSRAIRSHSDVDAIIFKAFPLEDFRSILKPGRNILAIHALNRLTSDSDGLWDAEVVGITALPPPAVTTLHVSEVAAGSENEFFIELRNSGQESIDISGYRIRNDRSDRPDYRVPNRQLAGGEYLVITANELGWTAAEGDHFLLMDVADRVLDGFRVEDRIRGRSDKYGRRWMNATEPTPGRANDLSLNDDVVINEIMYHAAPILGTADTPATFVSTDLISMTHDAWRFNASGSALPADWPSRDYTADDDGWRIGQGLIGVESNDLGVPINTVVSSPRDNDPRFLTYYFQTQFEMTADAMNSLDRLGLSHFVDDGAVFYINGKEVSRFNMPNGDVDFETRASQSIAGAQLFGPVLLPKDLVHVGTNTLSAEVHLRIGSSANVVFGAELLHQQIETPRIPGQSFRKRSELEWIELYNRGPSTIDVSGWQLDGGVNMDIPKGTQIAANDYLVIAKDAAAFTEIYPTVPAIGNFSGSLSNHDELVRLLDDNNNIADEVHYYEGGRWPETADGGGSTLELISADADNNNGASWAASDESSKSEWVFHEFQGRSSRDVFGPKVLFHEFIFGLLDSGEFLIDDIRVIKDPDGENAQVIQNGTFEADAVGEAPDKWRLIGNHSGTVIQDPTDPANQVLHMVASGAQGFVHDHAETTFADNEQIVDGVDYKISFRAKWLTGSRQLNNRIWFNRLAKTLVLDAPSQVGSPGAANGSATANIGPSYADFGHFPTTPEDGEPVTVQVGADDPDGIEQITLFWRPNDGEWNTVEMKADGQGPFRAQIPGHESGEVVQFYVEATDTLGAASTYPAEGPDSRAMLQVDDGEGPRTEIDGFRIILANGELAALFQSVNRMSNRLLPMTLVHNQTSYYDVGVRLVGSRWIRPNSGYKIVLDPANPFHGVHDSLRFDINGLAEIVMKQMLNRSGGQSASSYEDISYLVSPRAGHTQEFILQLARFDNVFLNEQFVNGSEGTKWELDDITVASNPAGNDPEGLKTNTQVNTISDIGVNTATVNQLDGDPEFFRGHLLIKNNRAKDDFEAIFELATAIHKQGDQLFEATNQIMDVDLWMRHYANQSYFGNWDSYGFRRPKNLRIYRRPDDGRFIPFFWDCDLCNFTEPIKTVNESTSRLDDIRDIPHNLRMYWGHMLDYINTSFNEEYVTRWAAHYGALAGGQSHGGDESFTTITRSTAARTEAALKTIELDIPRVDFQITSGGGEEIAVDTPTVVLEGKGWVDVRSIRLAGTEQGLDAFWPTEDGWRIEVPIPLSTQEISLEAIDFRDNLIASDSITVRRNGVDPVMDSLRISEIQYNPGPLTESEQALGFNDKDDFEYIELTNIGSDPIPLGKVEFEKSGNGEQGVEFRFSDGETSELAAGQSIVVVEDLDAFRARYGPNPLVAGQWSGGLSNDSEPIVLTSDGLILHEFAYHDEWHPATDGTGRSLQVVDVAHANLVDWNRAAGWRPSSPRLGSPGQMEAVLGDANRDNVFDSLDLVTILQANEYEDDIVGNSTFEEGDFNDDGDVTSDDLVWVLTYGEFNHDNAVLVNAVVSEPRNAQVSSRNGTVAETQATKAPRLRRPRTFLEKRVAALPTHGVDRLFEDSTGDLTTTDDSGLQDGILPLLGDDLEEQV